MMQVTVHITTGKSVTATRYVELLCATCHIMIVLRVTVFAIIIQLHSFMGTLNGLIILACVRMRTAGLSDRVCPSVSVCLSVYNKIFTRYIHHVKQLLNPTVTLKYKNKRRVCTWYRPKRFYSPHIQLFLIYDRSTAQIRRSSGIHGLWIRGHSHCVLGTT